MNFLYAFRAEWMLLNRRRMWLATSLVLAAFTVVATMVMLSTASTTTGTASSATVGINLRALDGAGGATAAVIASVGFSSLLVLAAFAGSTTNEFARGTLRAALTKLPNRWALLAGKLGARTTVAAILMIGALVVGAITSTVYAPSQHIVTTDWFGLAGLGHAATDYGRLLVFVLVYALIGTTVAVVVRSTPITLAVCFVWFGPVENVLGGDRAWAQRWFPGVVLRSLLRPDNPGALATGTALWTLSLYVAACIAVIVFVTARRDVTA